jgi:RNA polymerase sigma-70 factor (ECF subfamily)
MTPAAATVPPLSSLTSLSDAEIVARVLGGETALFEILMRRHNERIYRAARAILREDSEAEDVMQQA